MSAEGNSRPIGRTQQDFHEKRSQSVTDELEGHIHMAPSQVTDRPDDLNGPGAKGCAEPLTLQSSLIHAEQTTIAVSGPSASSMIVGSVNTPRISRPEEVSEEEPPKEAIKLKEVSEEEPPKETIKLSTPKEVSEEERLQDNEDSRKRSAAAVYQSPLPYPIPSVDDHERLQASTKKCTCKRIISFLTIATVTTITILTLFSAITLFILGKVLSNHYSLIPNTSLLQILPNDTVLLNNGTSAHDIVISEIVTPPTHRPNIILYIVDCNKLIKHEEHYTDSRTSPPYDQNIAKPIFPYYPHYEVGSSFNFSIEVLSATEQSSFSVLIFDNESQALDYTNNPTPQTGQEAIQSWSIATNETTTNSLYYKTLYGGYFVPVFSFETNGSLQIEYSYTIIRQFYLNTDYEADEYKNCYLRYNESCSLNLEDKKNKTCILAYRQPSLENSIDLQTLTESSKVSIPRYKRILTNTSYGMSGFVAILIIVLVAMISVCIRTCLKRNEQNQYHLLRPVHLASS